MAKLKYGNIDDLIPDDQNANKGTDRGQAMIEDSIEVLGLGRSVLVDKNDKLIAGNKTQKGAKKKGVQKTIIVETDGTELIVVKRTDLSIDDEKGRALALADNRTAEANLNWEPGNLEIHFDAITNLGLDSLVFDMPQVITDEDLSGLFTPRAGKDQNDEDDQGDDGETWGNGGNVPPFSFVLTYTESDYEKVKEAIAQIGGTPEKVLFDLLGLTD